MAGFGSKEEMQPVIERWLTAVAADHQIASRCKGIHCSIGFEITDPELKFYTDFEDGVVATGLGEAPGGGVVIEMDGDTFDGMMTGEIDGATAAMSGQMSFSGDITAAMGLQALQEDMIRLYTQAKAGVQA